MEQKTKRKAFVGILLIAALMMSMIGCNASKAAASASSSQSSGITSSSESIISSQPLASSESTVASVSSISSSKINSVVSSKPSSSKPKSSTAAKSKSTGSKSTSLSYSLKEVLDYRRSTAAIVQEINDSSQDFLTELSTLDSDSASTKTEVIAYFNDLETYFKKLGGLAAPGPYAQVQASYKQASAKAISSLETLKKAINSVTESTDPDVLQKQLHENCMDFVNAVNSIAAAYQKEGTIL
jgi:hypothetical protein